MPRKAPDYPLQHPPGGPGNQAWPPQRGRPRPPQTAVWPASLPRAHHRQEETERPSLPLWFCRRVASRLSFSNTAPWGCGLCGSQAGWRYRKLSVTSPAPLLGLKPWFHTDQGSFTQKVQTQGFPRPQLNQRGNQGSDRGGESLVGERGRERLGPYSVGRAWMSDGWKYWASPSVPSSFMG